MNKVEKKLDVLCLGAAVVDIPLRPVSREVFDIESYPVDNIAMAVGGDAMNESTIISRLGCKTGLMAAIGDDAAGAFILRSCDEDNIDTEGVTIDPNLNTSINIGLVTEDGERTFITNRNGSLWKENIEHVNFDKIKEAKILSLASIFNCPLLDGKTLEKIFSFAKEHGMTITADMIMPRLGETLDDIAGALQYVDYFFPNYDEACLMTGEKDEAKVADKLFSYGIKNVVMKIGTRGCYIRNKDGVMIVPACKGITAVDTIGAGDNGKKVAKQLGIPCYDAEIIQEMVKETGFTPEYVKEAGEYTPGSFLSSAFSNRLFGPTNEDILWEHQYKVITELAQKGPCVIVGRCADYILQDKADCLKVFIHADMDFRARRIVEVYGEREQSPEERLRDILVSPQ